MIVIFRQEVRLFTDKQIELLASFANQAVIAIENTRLLNELRQRTGDLTESLEQQTATSEVLKVISSSPGELEPVFEAMLANAVRICEAKFGSLFRYDGKLLHCVAGVGIPAALAELQEQRGPYRPEAGNLMDRVILTREVAHTADYAAEPLPGNAAKLGGARSTVAVPMLKDKELVGTIIIYRQEVRPFTDKQIELVTNFAAQAVIAIENTRLLNELRQRTDDLTEALEQQTATSEVLAVISSSPGETEPVFQAMLANATRICEAKFGNLTLWEGDGFRAVAVHGEAAFTERRRQNPKISILGYPTLPLARLAVAKTVVHVDDLSAEQAYFERHSSTVELVEVGGARTLLSVPMLKEDELVGAIVLYRQEVRPFTDKQIELVQNFAAQAVIAIENARLLNELRHARSPVAAAADRNGRGAERHLKLAGRELGPVFQTVLANATRLCEANFGQLLLCEDGGFSHCRDAVGLPRYADALSPIGHLPGSGTPLGRAWCDQAVAPRRRPHPGGGVQGRRTPSSVRFVETAGVRTLLAVPMLKENELIGEISVYRQEVRPFSDRQIALLQNFAAQAVIAIENTRLLNELRQSLEQQTATAEVLSVISSSPGELEPVFQAMLENAVRICEAVSAIYFASKASISIAR